MFAGFWNTGICRLARPLLSCPRMINCQPLRFSSSLVRGRPGSSEEGVDENISRKRAEHRENHRKTEEDPALVMRRREAAKRYYQEKKQSDPLYYHAAYLKAKQKRAVEGSEHRKKFLERKRERRKLDREAYRIYRRTLYHEDPLYKRYMLFTKWIWRSSWARDSTWITHEPITYPSRVSKRCSSCNITRINGSARWWRRKDDPELYDCLKCFVENFPYMPIGYEDIELGSGKHVKRRYVSEETIASAIASHAKGKEDTTSSK